MNSRYLSYQRAISVAESRGYSLKESYEEDWSIERVGYHSLYCLKCNSLKRVKKVDKTIVECYQCRLNELNRMLS